MLGDGDLASTTLIPTPDPSLALPLLNKGHSFFEQNINGFAQVKQIGQVRQVKLIEKVEQIEQATQTTHINQASQTEQEEFISQHFVEQLGQMEQVKQLKQIKPIEAVSSTNNKLRVVMAEDNSCYLKEIVPNSNTYWFFYN